MSDFNLIERLKEHKNGHDGRPLECILLKKQKPNKKKKIVVKNKENFWIERHLYATYNPNYPNLVNQNSNPNYRPNPNPNYRLNPNPYQSVTSRLKLLEMQVDNMSHLVLGQAQLIRNLRNVMNASPPSSEYPDQDNQKLVEFSNNFNKTF